MSGENKINSAWEDIFTKYRILDKLSRDKIFKISAEQIKEFREPRLMTKFDWSDARPQLFKENDLSILPNSRGTYILGQFKAYKELKYEEKKPIRVNLPSWLRTFDSFQVTSEAVALNVAQMTGMIDRVMGNREDEPAAVSTITGRLKSGKLDYKIDLKNAKEPYTFNVENSQIEIDAGFENLNNLLVVEAKSKVPHDFIIRQLYYPFRSYASLGTGKNVIPIYFTHVDDIYNFHFFKFSDSNNYSSIKYIKQISFIVDQNLDITLDSVKKISHDSPNQEDTVTFPQADSFTRLLNILQNLDKPKDKFQLAISNNFNERQGDYYGNALLYLGFADKFEKKFQLTELGKKVASLPNSNRRNIIIINQILSKQCFNKIFIRTLVNGGNLDDEYIVNVLLNHGKSINSKSTAERRRSTVKNWISWIFKTVDTE